MVVRIELHGFDIIGFGEDREWENIMRDCAKVY
jgi:hypothetical protein